MYIDTSFLALAVGKVPHQDLEASIEMHHTRYVLVCMSLCAWENSGVPGEDFMPPSPPMYLHSLYCPPAFRWEASDHKDFHCQQ